MNNFEIIFYERENGDVQVENFLLSLDCKMRAKLIGIINILKEKGNLLREPYTKALSDGIFEIRGRVGNDISRVLYFFYFNNKIVFTNGFVKKTQKTPRNEILKAKKYREDYIKRCEDEKI